MKHYLLFLVLSFGLLAGAQVNLDSGLVAYYPFEGNANDLSNNAIHGTASGISYSTGVYGTANSSVVFYGTDSSYVDCGADNRGIDDTLVISAFVRTTFDGIGDIVSKYDPGNDEGYHFQISLGQVRLAGRDGSGTYRQTGFSTTLINDSLWHHLLGVIRGNTWILYVDCNLEGAESITFPTPNVASNAELGIGKDVFSDQKYLDCEVDEVRLYDRLLTQDERDSLCATAVYASMEEPLQAESKSHFNVYPNPTNGSIAITTEEYLNEAVVKIYDISGQLLMQEEVNGLTPVIDLTFLESGNYIIHLQNKEKSYYSRLIKQ